VRIEDSDVAAFLRYAARERVLNQDERDRAALGLPPVPEAYARLRHRNRLMLYAATRRDHAGYRMRLRRPPRDTGVPTAYPTPLLVVCFELDGRAATYSIGCN
jgi:hypothetical protein